MLCNVISLSRDVYSSEVCVPEAVCFSFIAGRRKKRARTALDREAKPEVGQSAAVTSEISASPKTFEVCGRKFVLHL